MKQKIISFSALLLILPFKGMADGSCMVEHENTKWHIYTKTCFENVYMDKLDFTERCMRGEFAQDEDENAVIKQRVVLKCPVQHLGACIDANTPLSHEKMPFNTYYIVNEGIEYAEKGCIANGGKWVKK